MHILTKTKGYFKDAVCPICKTVFEKLISSNKKFCNNCHSVGVSNSHKGSHNGWGVNKYNEEWKSKYRKEQDKINEWINKVVICGDKGDENL